MGADTEPLGREEPCGASLEDGFTIGVVSKVDKFPKASNRTSGIPEMSGTDLCNEGNPSVIISQMPPEAAGVKYGRAGYRICNVDAAQSQSRGKYPFSIT